MKRCLDVTGTDPGQAQASTKMLPKDTEEVGPGPFSKNFVPSSTKTEAGATMAPMTLLGLQSVRTGGNQIKSVLRGNQIKSVPVTDEEVQAQGRQVKWYR